MFKRWIVVIALSLLTPTVGLGQDHDAGGKFRWYKGNTHTHTLNSDGDSAPKDVVKWYRHNKYNFVFITDHEFITEVEPLNREFGVHGEFLVISGQEITDRLNGKPYHVNGLGITQVCMPQHGETVKENLQKNIDCVRSRGGVPKINHPNFGWALTAESIIDTARASIFELYNGHPTVNNQGGGNSPSVEEIWDKVLSAGKMIYGVASDDSHYFKRLGDRSAPTPGQGWIVVRAGELSSSAILAAIDKGDFYSSTGVELAELDANKREISIKVREERWSKYKILFIGKGGRVLQSVSAGQATYKIRGDEGYVRAKVIESNGKVAWTQPVMVRK